MSNIKLFPCAEAAAESMIRDVDLYPSGKLRLVIA